MNIYSAVNIKQSNIDITTGKKLSHAEVYDRIVDYLGGLSAVAPYIPFEIEKIREALKKDEHLNNLPLRIWDTAAGFRIEGPNATPTFGELWDLYRANGINLACPATGVCILKHAARRIAELPDDEVEKIYANAKRAPRKFPINTKRS